MNRVSTKKIRDMYVSVLPACLGKSPRAQNVPPTESVLMLVTPLEDEDEKKRKKEKNSGK